MNPSLSAANIGVEVRISTMVKHKIIIFFIAFLLSSILLSK
jgi:hypothetical protein